MRRRPPHRVVLKRRDRYLLQDLLQDGRTEQRVARRARILLEMAWKKTIVEELADRVGLTPTGVWYLCRRYEERGWEAVYDTPRGGRPRQISPPGAGANRTVGVL
jgi:DNA-binding Lrp family transcriptional regulator